MRNKYRLRTAVCKGCGTEFTKHMPEGRQYCSHSCFRKLPKPDRKTGSEVACVLCGKLIYLAKSTVKPTGNFCCVEHHNQWQSRNKTKHTCKTCGIEFTWSPSRHKNYTITYCSIPCRNADPDRKTILIEMNRKQQAGGMTSVERLGYGLLDTLGIEYQPQHLLADKFCVDAFIPLINTVVQFDGDYWHGNPVKFSEPDHRQQKRMRLDKSQDAYLSKCGYQIIRIWGSDLQHNQTAIRERLQQLLNQS